MDSKKLVAATLLCLAAIDAHATAVPEFGAGSMGSGLALIVGTLLMVFGRGK